MVQEKITAEYNKGVTSTDVLVQYNRELQSVGIGLQPISAVPDLHFIDALYGEAPQQTAIGQLFFEKRGLDLELDPPKDSDGEAEFFNQLGRDILDSITGSSDVCGIWTWLDRPGINRFIRILRKARDTAFGRDE